MLRPRASLLAAAALCAACSSSSPASTAPDASPDATGAADGAVAHDGSATDGASDAADAGDGGDADDGAACLASDASKPECLRGTPCHCDDVVSHDAPPICVAGSWQCPSGYTAFDQCGGVPPGPGCDAGAPQDAGDGG